MAPSLSSSRLPRSLPKTSTEQALGERAARAPKEAVQDACAVASEDAGTGPSACAGADAAPSPQVRQRQRRRLRQRVARARVDGMPV